MQQPTTEDDSPSLETVIDIIMMNSQPKLRRSAACDSIQIACEDVSAFPTGSCIVVETNFHYGTTPYRETIVIRKHGPFFRVENHLLRDNQSIKGLVWTHSQNKSAINQLFPDFIH